MFNPDCTVQSPCLSFFYSFASKDSREGKLNSQRTLWKYLASFDENEGSIETKHKSKEKFWICLLAGNPPFWLVGHIDPYIKFNEGVNCSLLLFLPYLPFPRPVLYVLLYTLGHLQWRGDIINVTILTLFLWKI